MDAIIATALDTARQRGAQYADIRLVFNREQRIVVRNGVVGNDDGGRIGRPGYPRAV